MAGAIHSTKHQKLAIEKTQEDQTKFHYHFLYKATIVLIFFVILPLFPSQAPEFINQSLLTRNWQLLHLLFVAVAISYGLFSRRSDETEKENNSKFDTAQSLVSKFLQVSSFFEDEVETSPESDETKVQIRSNQHHRNQPVVLVTQQIRHSGCFDNQSGEKPLLLPVRSLKSRLCDDDGVVDVQPVVDESCTTTSFSLNKSTISKTSSKRFSSNSYRVTRNAELEKNDKKKENVVLPSPIPWRSRSGRILEPKLEEVDTLTQQSSRPSTEESEFNKVEPRVFKSQTSRSSRTSSLSPSPKFAPSSESLAKNAEDSLKKKAFYESCPPPPPPPPPMMFQKSISMKPRYGSFNERASFDNKLKRSFTSERNSMKSGIEVKKKSEEKQHSMQEPTREYVASVGSMEFGDEEKERFIDKVLVESDDDDEEETETEDEDVGGGGRIVQNKSEESSHVGGQSSKIDGPSFGSDEGPDVDKKADEFIAKFREQIRLQRIESIKRTTRTTRNSSR